MQTRKSLIGHTEPLEVTLAYREKMRQGLQAMTDQFNRRMLEQEKERAEAKDKASPPTK